MLDGIDGCGGVCAVPPEPSKHSCGCIVIFPTPLHWWKLLLNIFTFPLFRFSLPRSSRVSSSAHGGVERVRSFGERWANFDGSYFHHVKTFFTIDLNLLLGLVSLTRSSSPVHRSHFLLFSNVNRPPLAVKRRRLRWRDELYAKAIRDRIISHIAIAALPFLYLFDCLTRQ